MTFVQVVEFYIVLFLLTFGPKLVCFGNIDMVSVTSFYCLFRFGLYNSHFCIRNLIIFLLCCISLISISFNESFAILMSARYFRVLFNAMSVIALVEYFKNKLNVEELINALIFIITVHSLIMIVEIFSGSFKSFVETLVGKRRGIRISGLTAGFGSTSIILVIPAILYVIGVYRNVLYVVVNIFACFFSGRLGLYFFFLFLPLIFLHRTIFHFNKKFFIQLVIMSFLISSILYISYSIAIKNSFFYWYMSTPLAGFLHMAFEPIISYFSTGELSSRTTSAINEMGFVFNNQSFFEYIFGTGYWGREEFHYLKTDIGYALMFNSVGVIGVLLSFIFYVNGCVFSAVNLKNEIYFLLFVLSLICLLGQYKQTILFTRNLFTVYIFIFEICKIINDKSNSNFRSIFNKL